MLLGCDAAVSRHRARSVAARCARDETQVVACKHAHVVFVYFWERCDHLQARRRTFTEGDHRRREHTIPKASGGETRMVESRARVSVPVDQISLKGGRGEDVRCKPLGRPRSVSHTRQGRSPESSPAGDPGAFRAWNCWSKS